MISKFKMNLPGAGNSFKIRLVIMCNTILFTAAVFLINLSMNYSADRIEVTAGRDNTVEEDIIPPNEVPFSVFNQFEIIP